VAGRSKLGSFRFLHRTSTWYLPEVERCSSSERIVSPFLTVGGGLAHLGLGSGNRNTGALQFGGGADFNSPIRHLGFRAEVHDFFAPKTFESSPLTQVTAADQHTIFAGGGVVFRF
jgi:hypothetical protein